MDMLRASLITLLLLVSNRAAAACAWRQAAYFLVAWDYLCGGFLDHRVRPIL